MAIKKPLVDNSGIQGELVSGDDLQAQNAIIVPEIASPSTPAAGNVKIYAKSDGKVYRKDDAGTEAELGGGAGSGTYGGNSLRYLFDSSTSMGDPGLGDFRLNNATLSSATSLSISTQDADTSSVISWLYACLTDGSVVRFVKETDSTNFFIYTVSNYAIDGGLTFSTADLVNIAGNGSAFANGDSIVVTVSTIGPTGSFSENEISPSSITSDQDDYNPTGWSSATVARISGDNGIRAITSFNSSVTQKRKLLLNVGSYPWYIPGQHPDGTAGYRVITDRDVIVYPNDGIQIYQDSTSSRWRIATGPSVYEPKSLKYYRAAGSVTAGDWGMWASGVSGGAVTGNSAAGFPPYVQLSTGTGSTAATASAAVWMPKTDVYIGEAGAAHMSAEFFTYIPNLSDGTNTYEAYWKLTLNPAGIYVHLNSFGIRYSSTINSGKFQLYSQDSGGTTSTADTGVTVAADTLYLIRVEIDKSRSEVRAYIDGVPVGRVTANLPASGVDLAIGACILKTAGTTARTIRLASMGGAAIYP